MKGPLDRTKVVLRHLPPTISQSNLVEQVDSRFSGRYNWLAFRPGKSSLKHLTYSRAHIEFNKAEDVIEFAEFFNGHVFVNEKGTQFKTIVEYAPSQRVPSQWSKKDGREGTILKDPEYLEFLEFVAKPVENLPSAEIQLERKEANRAGAPKGDPIVTPLMDFVRQKRAAKGGSRRTVLNGKSTRSVGGISSRNQVSGSSKRGSEKKRATAMYVSRDSSKLVSSNIKSTNLLMHKQDDQQLMGNSVNSAAVSGTKALEGESGGIGSTGIGMKKILLLKGKEKEIPNVSVGSSLQIDVASLAKPSHSPAPAKQNQRRESGGKNVRCILLTRDTRQPVTSSNQDWDNKRPPRPSNGGPENYKVVSNNLLSEKQERRTRNKDRPDRGVWTPLRRSDASDESLFSSTTSQTSQVVDSAEGTNIETKHETLFTRGGRGGRRGSAYSYKDSDGSSTVEGKALKRGASSGYGSLEKQVWVQKTSSGT